MVLGIVISEAYNLHYRVSQKIKISLIALHFTTDCANMYYIGSSLCNL